jgi:hypothetical protein
MSPWGRRRVHLVGVCGGALVVEQMARSQPRRIISTVVAGLDLLPTYAAAAAAASASSSAEDSSTTPSPPPAVPDATDTTGWAAAREALPGRYRPAADDDGQWASGPLALLVGAESTSAAATAARHGAARSHAQRLAAVVAAWSVGGGGRVVAARLPLGAGGAADDGGDDGSAEEAAIAQLAAVDVTALLLGTGSSDGGL